MKHIILPFLFSICLLLAGCSYHLDVEQGNVLSANQIKRLKKGMTASQVQHLLGSPVLINNFNDDRMYYVYTFQKGSSSHMVHKHLTVQFQNGHVVKIIDHYPSKQ